MEHVLLVIIGFGDRQSVIDEFALFPTFGKS